ncbi:MAG: hypothetical protein HZB53_21720 [Chloroflexi bacterium]|nr:hypothetical protein [Chloroflexota bacterium]
MIDDVLPADAFLATHYHERRIETRRVYFNDGRVDAYDGAAWWRVCDLTADQVRQAQAAIRASGLLTARDMSAGGVYDTATLTYAWSLDGQAGSVTNYAYPARKHPVFEALDRALDALVDAAAPPDTDEP